METALPSIPVNMLYAQQLHYLLFIIISVTKTSSSFTHLLTAERGDF